jgi:hypothetical protein
MKKTIILFNLNNSNINNLANVNSLLETLNSVLIGIMLGDGSLYRSSLTSDTRFEISFGKNIKVFLKL